MCHIQCILQSPIFRRCPFVCSPSFQPFNTRTDLILYPFVLINSIYNKHVSTRRTKRHQSIKTIFVCTPAALLQRIRAILSRRAQTIVRRNPRTSSSSCIMQRPACRLCVAIHAAGSSDLYLTYRRLRIQTVFPRENIF